MIAQENKIYLFGMIILFSIISSYTISGQWSLVMKLVGTSSLDYYEGNNVSVFINGLLHNVYETTVYSMIVL